MKSATLRLLGPAVALPLARAAVTACGLGLLASCASPVPPAGPGATTPLARSAVTPPAPPDVTAVAVPENLIAFARVKSLAASGKVVAEWARLPVVDPTTFLAGLLEGFTGSKDNAALGAVIDPAEPIDFVASFEARLPPRVLHAFAAAVRNVGQAESALATAYAVTPLEDGVFQLTLRPERVTSKSDDDDGPPSCELRPSAGASPYRLVCGGNHAALVELGPYLARTTPRSSIPADVHLELLARSVAGFATIGRLQGPKMIGSMLGLNAAQEPATFELATAALGDVFDYVGDLDAMTYDATTEPGGLSLVARTTFKSDASRLAEVLTQHPDRVDVPPSVLWRLPGDVDLASFGGTEPAELEHPRELLLAALGEQLAKAKLGEADRHAVLELLKETVRGGRGVLAHGMDGADSYWLWERDEPAAREEKFFRGVAETLARPGLSKWLRGKVPAPSTLPTWALPTWRVAAPVAGLPAGSLHLEITTVEPPPAAGPPPALHAGPATQTYHLVVVPDGPRTWCGLSLRESTLRARLTAVTSPNGPLGSLGARAGEKGLDSFKESRMTSGGFFTVRSVLELARQSLSGAKNAAKATRLEALAQRLPARGVTPIVVTTAAGEKTPDDPGGVYTFQLHLPADSIRDAVWFGLNADSLTGP